MLVDTHCHLDFPEFEPDRAEVIERAKAAGLGYIINIASSLEGSRRSVDLASQYDFIYASVGIHPHEADAFNKEQEAALRGLIKSAKVVAVGEIGLDYFKNYSKAENQRALFVSLLKLAKDFDLPAIIHSRQAGIDTLKILKDNMPLRAVLHCFSGDEEFLQSCLGLGFFISFTCNITYKKAQNLRRLVKLTPLDRLLLETDAPFLSPENMRGKRNEPMNVQYLAGEVAGIKEISPDEVAVNTTNNAKIFFRL